MGNNLNFRFFLGFIPLMKLIQKSFWRNFFGPFFVFIFPVIFISIVGSLMGYVEILGGIMAFSSVAISLISMPQLIYEFKNSSLLKRLGSTPIKPELFLFCLLLFYLGILILSIIWYFLFSLIFFGGQYWNNGFYVGDYKLKIQYGTFLEILKNINWLGFIYGEFLLIITSLLIGIVIGICGKTSIFVQGAGMMVLLLSQFLGCMIIPVSIVREIEPIWYMGYILSPFKPSNNIILESWNGTQSVTWTNTNIINIFNQSSNPFDLYQNCFSINSTKLGTGRPSILVFNFSEKLTSQLLPYFWIILFSIISIRFLKFSNR